MVHLTRRYRFSAAHRLHAPGLSREENARLYGKCNNPHGHGHNYVLDVTVSGRIDPETGMVCDLGFLDSLVRSEVLDKFDEVNLNLDTESFRDQVPTSENICVEVHRLLAPHLEGAGPGREVRLERVRLGETAANSIEYFGRGGGAGAGRKVMS